LREYTDVKNGFSLARKRERGREFHDRKDARIV